MNKAVKSDKLILNARRSFMKILKYKIFCLAASILFLTGCNAVNVSKADSVPTPPKKTSKKALNEIDLTAIKHILPKGRAQDDALQDENFKELPLADDLLAHGKDSIPFLISKLDDETKLNRQIINYWSEVYLGDIALIILNDFFTKSDGLNSTIPGFGWDEFLERGNDKDSMGEEILRKFIEKRGRQTIKARWQKMWDENKENVFWDESEQCFSLKK